MNPQQELEKLRIQIDTLDRELVEVFERRMALSSRVGKIKAENNMPVLDEERERQVLDNATRHVTPENRQEVVAFMRGVMEISKNRQRNQK